MKEIDSKTSWACNAIFKLMIIMAVFDGIRSRTPIGNFLTIFKEFSTFSLLIIILLSYRGLIQRRVLLFSNLLLLIYFITIGTIAIIINDVSTTEIPALHRAGLPSAMAMHFKNIESFLIVFVLLHYEFLTGKKIDALLKYFVHLCAFYVCFTLLFYFVIDIPSFFQKPWYGRISIGYPTSDAQILSFGLLFLVFAKKSFTPLLKMTYIFILIVGIVMNATATGLVSVGIILAAYLVYYLFSGKVIYTFSIKNIIAVSLIVLIGFAAQLVISNIGNNLKTFSSLLDTKVGFVTNKINNPVLDNRTSTNSNLDFSEEVRKFQIGKAFIVNNDFASLALGGPISLGTVIENENYFILRSYGYLGLILYYVWLFILTGLSLYYIRHSYAQLLIVAIAILVLTNSAIITTYLFGIAVTFGLFVSYFYNSNDESVLSLNYLYESDDDNEPEEED